NVEIFTEGKTDAEIISHAFKVITDDETPYWSIQSCRRASITSGGATELAKLLESIAPKLSIENDKSKIIIGIFDNDAKGNQEFNGLRDNLFTNITNRIKKHIEENIFAMKLPIPNDMDMYLQDKQEFRFFSIEHYFPLDYLKEHNMVKETSIKGVFEIKGTKTKFASTIQKSFNEQLFLDFRWLFDEIDHITNQETKYTI
ncbi:MAG: hypothetical protein GQ534_05155, partial [Candidatus Delongbacteria bacterium]|nr:hypothetical protein [Candidatus Delongbacteria bacterium]